MRIQTRKAVRVALPKYHKPTPKAAEVLGASPLIDEDSCLFEFLDECGVGVGIGYDSVDDVNSREVARAARAEFGGVAKKYALVAEGQDVFLEFSLNFGGFARAAVEVDAVAREERLVDGEFFYHIPTGEAAVAVAESVEFAARGD